MDTLTYGLSQSIGIYYKDKEWRNKVFDSVINHYPKDWFNGIKESKYECFIELKDGTTIRFVPATKDQRSNCFSKIILQPGFNCDVIKEIIMPTLKHQNRQIMILKDNDEGLDISW